MILWSAYLSFRLENPLVASASPLTGSIDGLKQLEDAGIAAVVLPSLFEEQIEHDEMQVSLLQDEGAHAFGEAAGGYFPELDDYNTGPDAYLRLIDSAKASLDIPVIASLNGTSLGGWLDYAGQIEQAGADAIELNVYFIPADPSMDSADVEGRYVDLVRSIRRATTVPISIKLHPFLSAPIDMARRLVGAGADGLVLFNRFFQPDIDLESLDVLPDLQLSTSLDVKLPLRWTAILRGRVKASIATTSGAHTVEDIVKLLLVGADAVQLASVLLKNGPNHARKLLDGLRAWLSEREYASVEQMKGSMSSMNAPDPAAFERHNYMTALTTYTNPHHP